MRNMILDNNAAIAFVIAQQQSISAKVYQTKFADLTWRQRVFVDTSDNPFAGSVTYYGFEAVGQARFINGNSQDVPMVDLGMTKGQVAVHTAGVGYGFGREEIGQAKYLGVDLPAQGAIAANRAFEEHCQKIAFNGDVDRGLEGLFTNPSVTTGPAAAAAVGGQTFWSTKTGDEIVADINNALMGIQADTVGVEIADTIALPLAQFNLLTTKRMGQTADGVNQSVFEYIRKHNVYSATTGRDLTIFADHALKGAGAGNTDRMAAYRNGPDVVTFRLPMPHNFLEPQLWGLRVQVPGWYRVAGVDWMLPKAGTFVDGI